MRINTHTPHTHSSMIYSFITVFRHINEDKRKTEGQMQMFEVLRDVEDCPVSTHTHTHTRTRTRTHTTHTCTHTHTHTHTTHTHTHTHTQNIHVLLLA